MVYYLVGKLDCIDSWIKAGILVSESAIITGGRRSTEEQEHMVDAAHILAAQKIAKYEERERGRGGGILCLEPCRHYKSDSM